MADAQAVLARPRMRHQAKEAAPSLTPHSRSLANGNNLAQMSSGQKNRLLLQSWAQLQSSTELDKMQVQSYSLAQPPPPPPNKNCLVYAYRFKTELIQHQALAHFFLHLSSYLLHLYSFCGVFLFQIGFAKSSLGSWDCRTLIMQWSTSV